MNQTNKITECISIFDMLKIGVGPSSSHTLGPWKAVLAWLKTFAVKEANLLQIHLFGSLAKTGIGHSTDIAVLMGLLGEQAETTDTELISEKIALIKEKKQLKLNGEQIIHFDFEKDIIFHFDECLDFHTNGMRFEAFDKAGFLISSETYYSLGGGFFSQENETVKASNKVILPYPCDAAKDLLQYCNQEQFSIYEMVWTNERTWYSDEKIARKLNKIWQTMFNCLYVGCHKEGRLPGGLDVKRRAAEMNQKLLSTNESTYSNAEEWMHIIKTSDVDFSKILHWISCFAFAVNEENAAMGRIVTAPTNGASGVIPSVIMYMLCFSEKRFEEPKKLINQFLCVAGELGTFFKKSATISAAMGGCQAEIGVSSAMAAGALTECLGGTVQQALMAAEIAMEHHLGLTCDPVGGLVQIPCIERNSMGAIKAITATNIALGSDANYAKVSLDDVIKTMWETAKDMNTKYKETSEGGLAINLSVNLVEC